VPDDLQHTTIEQGVPAGPKRIDIARQQPFWTSRATGLDQFQQPGRDAVLQVRDGAIGLLHGQQMFGALSLVVGLFVQARFALAGYVCLLAQLLFLKLCQLGL
jgi:hypothetical protein